jgi:hypothetical protein
VAASVLDDAGHPEKGTQDYLRDGTTSLFAAFSTADGTGISSLHRRHRVWIAPPTTADVGLLRTAD